MRSAVVALAPLLWLLACSAPSTPCAYLSDCPMETPAPEEPDGGSKVPAEDGGKQDPTATDGGAPARPDAGIGDGGASSCADVCDGLVGWWKLDDGSGPVARDSVGSNPARLPVSATWADVTACHSGPCLRLSGSGAATVEETRGLPTGFDSASISLWARLPGLIGPVGTNAIALSYGTLSAGGYLALGMGNRGQLFISDGSQDLTASSSVDFSSWRHVAATISPFGTTLYVDGAAVAQSFVSFLFPPSAPPQLGLGGRFASSLPFSDWYGFLDDVRFYNRALAPAEVQRLALVADGGASR